MAYFNQLIEGYFMTLERQLATLLSQKHLTLSLAESCTGGLISHRLTNVPGSSTFFLLSIIAYDNKAKTKLLGVSPATIKTHGAVSRPTALAMSHGVRRILGTDISIAVTGIAGPSGGSALKPVGTVFIAYHFKKKSLCQQFHFKGSRARIKTQAADAVLKLLISLVKS